VNRARTGRRHVGSQARSHVLQGNGNLYRALAVGLNLRRAQDSASISIDQWAHVLYRPVPCRSEFSRVQYRVIWVKGRVSVRVIAVPMAPTD